MDRADQVFSELAAQMVNVDFDGIALDFLAPAVQCLFELASGLHVSRVLEQMKQQ
jgi:hypothetical protein